MKVSASFKLTAADRPAGLRAGEWIEGFYPDVIVTFGGSRVQLECERRSVATLELIWHSYLANEKLLERGAADRSSVLQTLLQ